MFMENIKRIRINKNRGWRGLAELVAENEERDEVLKMIFSFSQPVWDDMLCGRIVVQDKNYYVVLSFDNVDELPHGHQRSVLIKNFTATIIDIHKYPKEDWIHSALTHGHYDLISHFIKNRNNHTTSDWNCIGIRVTPTI